MKFRKIFSAILGASIVSSLVIIPSLAEETAKTEFVSYINDDFEDGDISDWAFRDNVSGGSSGTKTATLVEEDGNNFLRMSYTGNHVDGSGKVVMFSKKFSEGAFDMPDDGITVIELKFRTNQMNLRKMLKFNYPTSSEYAGDCYNEMAINTRQFMLMHSNGNAMYFNSQTVANGAVQGSGGTLYSGYQVNKWYRLKMVMDFENEKVYYAIYDADSSELLASTGAKNMTAWWFKYHDQNKKYPIDNQILKDFTLMFRNGVTVADERIDIDDFKVYTQKSVITAEIVNDAENGIIMKPTTMLLKFDGPVEISEGGISVINEDGEEFVHAGNYDEESFTYTANFSSSLPAGDYRFVINPELAVPVNGAEDIFSDIGYKFLEIPFSTFDTMPPVVRNVTIGGRLILGEILTGEYEYISEEEEGESIFEWYMADSKDASEDEWILLDEEQKEIEVTNEILEKYLKFAVTPVDSRGLKGEKIFSSVIAPERAPIVENVEVNTKNIFTKSYVSAVYDYFDENNDTETDSEINWYISEDGIENWNKFATGKSCYISDESVGKYIKFTVIPVNEAKELGKGTLVESDVVGPVKDFLTSTNRFSNPGLEDGVEEPWKAVGSENYEGVKIVEGNVYSGNYALRFCQRLVNDSDKAYQSVELEEGKRYILSAMVRKTGSGSPDISSLEGYCWGGSIDRPYRVEEYTAVNSASEWKRVTLTFDTKASGVFNLGFLSFSPFNSDFVIDDAYVGELYITDIETADIKEIEIPKNGSVEIPFTEGKILNQFGETKGLTTQKVNIDFPSHQGVRFEDNKIIVDSTATVGKLNIELSCSPDYSGAAQKEFRKLVTIDLIAHDDLSPRVFNVTATGSTEEGNILVGSYEFHQVEGKADATVVRWIYSDSENGVYYDIPGATSDTYVVQKEYANKFIKFAVIPKTADGMVGNEVFSDCLTIPTKPVATNISVSGNFNVGETIKGEYDFKDVNKDGEGITTFKWYYSDAENGEYTEIIGENKDELVLAEALTDKYIKFAVTPVSESYPEIGEETFSKAYFGPTVPIVKNVEIKKQNGRLVGYYDYYHIHNAKEEGSIYEWKIDNSVVSNDASYPIDFTGRKTVTFSVTPVSNSNPSTGKTVSVSMTVQGRSSGVVTGGGSSGSGGYSGMITPSINKNDNEPEKLTGSDIDGHWGAEYIKKMETIGVMQADKNGNFNPDEFVSRESMITFLFKTLSLETTEYRNEFSDVLDGDFAKILQTMVDNGIIAKDVKFRPNDTISRQEMCKILYVSLVNAGKIEAPKEMQIKKFADYENISEWARPYVNGIYGTKIMVGVSDSIFDAKGKVTKAQAATMLTRMIELIEGGTK